MGVRAMVASSIDHGNTRAAARLAAPGGQREGRQSGQRRLQGLAAAEAHAGFSLGYPTISNPCSVPVLEPKRSELMPRRWSMLTYRLDSGGAFCALKARCWPCRKPPPATSTGRLRVEW